MSRHSRNHRHSDQHEHGNDRGHGRHNGQDRDHDDRGHGYSDRGFHGWNGDDTATYVMSDNSESHLRYNGGPGEDTLTLVLTAEEWASLSVQTDIAAYLSHLEEPHGGDRPFQFEAFDLNARSFENLRVIVDGVELDPADDPVTANDDTASVAQGASISGSVLANDTVPDLVAEVTLVSGPSEGQLTFNADGSYTFDAAGDFDDLAAGETRDVTFEYEVTDVDGDSDTATVTITVEGTNHNPETTAIDAGTVAENAGQISIDLLSTTTDVDGDDLEIVSLTATSTYSGQLNYSYDADTGVLLINPAQFALLNEGDTADVTFTYTISDGNGGTVENTATLTVEGARNQIVGTPGPNTLYGTSADDDIQGLAGDDSVSAEDGDDSVDGGDGNDTLNGREGDDTLTGGEGDDALQGHIGHDLLYGGAGHDDLRGFVGNDTLYGGSGDDILGGYHGFDSLDGGLGNDTLAGGEGRDTMDGGEGNDELSGGQGADSLHGGDGEDLLNGDGENDTIHGDDGNDTILGGSGDDSIRGGRGDDVIEGGDGDDIILPQRGADTLTGGEGADEFQFYRVGTYDRATNTITDFEVGTDGLFLNNLTIRSVTEMDVNGDGVLDTRIELDTGGTIDLLDVSGVLIDDILV